MSKMDPKKTKEELDRAIPFHTLLDISANKSKAQLAHKGTLSHRHKPSSEALRASVMRRSVSTASNFSSNASFHTPDESLEDSREATPDSDSGYVIATVTTTTTLTTTTNGNQPKKDAETSKQSPPPLLSLKGTFLAELQNKHRTQPDPKDASESSTSTPTAKEPAKPPPSKPKRMAPLPPISSGPTLADQLKARLEKRRISLEESEIASQENASAQSQAQNPPIVTPTVVTKAAISNASIPVSKEVEKKRGQLKHDNSKQDKFYLTRCVWIFKRITKREILPGSTNGPTSSPKSDLVEDWSKEQVSQWLVDNGFSIYKTQLSDKGVNGSSLLSLDSGSGLKDLGVKSKEEREKFKKKIKELKASNKEKKDILKKEKLLKKFDKVVTSKK